MVLAWLSSLESAVAPSSVERDALEGKKNAELGAGTYLAIRAYKGG